MGCSRVLWWDWASLKAVVKCYLQLLSSSLWFNPLLSSSCIKCSVSSDCGGAADVLEYIIITGISFTCKDESESLFPVLPLAYFCEAAQTLVNYFSKCLSAKLKHPPLLLLSDCVREIQTWHPLCWVTDSWQALEKNSPCLCNSPHKEWISRAGTWVVVQEWFRLAAAIWAGSFSSLEAEGAETELWRVFTLFLFYFPF